MATFCVSSFKDILKTKYLGKEIEFFKTLSSTNDHLLRNPRIEGKIVVASVQTNGMGRNNNRWENCDESLLFSVELPLIATNLLEPLNIIVGYSLVEAFSKYIGGTSLKWPNDIMISNKKVAGMVLKVNFSGEELTRIVLGVGVNMSGKTESIVVNGNITTLGDNYLKSLYPDVILASILLRLENNISKLITGELDIKAMWKDYTACKGGDISVTVGDEKKTYREYGINKDGGLIVIDSQRSLATITIGDVSIDNKQSEM